MMTSFNQNINTHFENINILAKIIQESQTLLNNNEEHSNVVIRFDALIPSFNSENIDLSINNREYNYNTLNINSEINSETIEDNSYDLYDINEYKHILNPLNDTCPITKCKFTPQQNVIMICKCKHIFNKSTLKRWITYNNTCPNCRVIINN